MKKKKGDEWGKKQRSEKGKKVQLNEYQRNSLEGHKDKNKESDRKEEEKKQQ